jgi:hypothetical protein
MAMEHLDLIGIDAARAGEATPREMEHARICAVCAEALKGLRDFEARLRSLSGHGVEVPAEVDRAILGRPRIVRRAPWRFAAATAAAVLVAAWGLLLVSPAHAYDVVDAYALSVQLREGRTPARSWDLDGNGIVDQGDVSLVLQKCTTVRNPEKREARGNRFVAVDVYVDVGERKLSAWQVEIACDPRAAIAGVEGGEPMAFREPPTYDPRALNGGKIVLAAFTPGDAPSGRVRVARLHLLESEKCTLEGKVAAAAGPGGERFDDAKIHLERTGDVK